MPEMKEGTCSWCGAHHKTLFLIVGQDPDLGITTDYICAECRQLLRKYSDYIKEVKQDGQQRKIHIPAD